MAEKDIFEIGELTDIEEMKESEIVEITFETEPVEIWETVEPNIRVKKINGKVVRYEVKIDLGREEVFDKKLQKYTTKQIKRSKSFDTLEKAREFKKIQLLAKKGKVEIVNGEDTIIKKRYKFVDIVDTFYKTREKLCKQGKIADSYLQQYRIQSDHFKKYFTKKDNTYIDNFDANTIEKFFDYMEEVEKKKKSTLEKYKSHLNQIWNYIVKNEKIYGLKKNVVALAEITALESDYEATVLDYKQLNELILEACQLEEPAFLYLVVYSMTQGLRRGELCGLKWEDVDFDTKQINIVHNRVQLGTEEVKKLPKNNKPRMIEMHKAGYDTLLLYKEWQEKILGRPVQPKEYVLQWEINLVQNYTCHTGKVSKKWKEIYNSINKYRIKAHKEPIPYGRIHDGKHTYITLAENGVKKDDGTVIDAVNYIQLYESAAHELPELLQNTSTQVYSEHIGARWEITEFWDKVISVDIANAWDTYSQIRQFEEESRTQKEKDLLAERKRRRYEKAKAERLKGNPPKEILLEYQ